MPFGIGEAVGGAAKITEVATKSASISKKESKIKEAESKIAEKKREIGAYYMNKYQSSEDIADKTVEHFCREIANIQKEIEGYNAAISEIRGSK